MPEKTQRKPYNKAYVEITNLCNMNCSFCHGHSRPPRRMSMEEFSLLLDRLEGLTEYLYYHLMGEPLTHPHLPDFLRLAGARGYKSIITTNGTLLREKGDEILRAGLHKANISLHSFESGTQKAHEEYVLALAEFAKKAAAMGTIVVFRLWNQGFDDGKNELALTLLKQSIAGEWQENTRGIRVREKIFVEFGERFAWPDANAEIQGDKFYCYGLKDQFGILSDGTVVPCCLDSDGAIPLGNAFTDDLGKILSSERAQKMCDGFRRGVATEALCMRCGYAQKFVR